jgi:hypothetical protein
MSRKPQPLFTPKQRKHCPVCGQAVYSAVDIHPQCAVVRADAKRMKGVKPKAKSATPAARDADTKPWQKTCPKCRMPLHVRKKTCDCGHNF